MTMITHEADVDAWMGPLKAMASLERDARVTGEWRRHETSLMEVLGRSTDEVANCRVLAWALDPLAHHGIGQELVRALLDRVGLPSDVPSWNASVRLEVAEASSRADIVVSGREPGSWTVVIEAKVHAAEGVDQCRRLEDDWADARLVFLGRSELQPRTARDVGRWTGLSWMWFIDRIDGALATGWDRDLSTPRSLARAALIGWTTSARRHLT